MSIKIKKHMAERFIDWYPFHTNLTLKGSYNADWRKHLELNNELFHQLVPFFEEMRKEIKNKAFEEAANHIEEGDGYLANNIRGLKNNQ